MLLLALAAATLVLPLSSPGRVFWRRPLRSRSIPGDRVPGSRVAYRAEVTANGDPARVSVQRVESPSELRPLLEEIARAFGPARTGAGGPDLAAATAVGPQGTLSLIGLPRAGADGHAVVVAIERPPVRATAGPRALPRVFPDLALYPGASAVSAMRNEDTGTAFEVWDAPADAARVCAFLGDALARSGWAPLRVGRPDAGIAVFQRGAGVCCVIVRPGADPRASRATVLQKPGALD
jgi:hypothetical protein